MAIWNERIKQKRIEKGFTLAQIAERLHVTEATAQRYESGSIKNVPYEHMRSYAEIFQCSPSYLAGWEEEKPEGQNPRSFLQEHFQDIAEAAGFSCNWITKDTQNPYYLIRKKDGTALHLSSADRDEFCESLLDFVRFKLRQFKTWRAQPDETVLSQLQALKKDYANLLSLYEKEKQEKPEDSPEYLQPLAAHAREDRTEEGLAKDIARIKKRKQQLDRG